MLFLVYGLDDPVRGTDIRRRTRAAHLKFVADNKDRFRYGGALLGDDGKMIGTLALIEAPDREALDRFLSGDPYNQAGLFKTAIINATKQILPELVPGFMAAEIARAELA